MRSGRSSSVVVRGRWQEASATLPLASTVMALTIHAIFSELLTSFYFLTRTTGAIPLPRLTSLLIPLLVMAVLWTGFFWLNVRRAERYFEQALLLSKDAR
jgi:hypothetical protein